MKGTQIYYQPKPQLQDSKNIINFACGSSHTIAVDSAGDAYALGSNDQFQLGIPSEKLCKSFKKIDNNMVGDIRKVFCINDCTFVVNSDMEVFFCGKHSLKSTSYFIQNKLNNVLDRLNLGMILKTLLQSLDQQELIMLQVNSVTVISGMSIQWLNLS